MNESRRRKWLGYTLAAGMGLGGLMASAEAEAAPSPSNKIRGRGGNFGVGVSLGDPLGASMKYFMAPNHAIQGDFGWGTLHHGNGRLGFDYLWHPGTFVSDPAFDFLPYLGVGVGMAFWAGRYYYGRDRRDRYYDDRRGGGVGLFLRAPILGIGFHWKKVPLDTMLEGSWSPYIIYPDLNHGDFSFKIRYYF